MNGDDAFEKRLRRASPRSLPQEWRKEILSAAHAAAVPGGVPSRGTKWAWSSLKALLWPHPTAWAGLAAAWIIIVLLNLSAREPGGPEIARHAPPPSPQMRELLRQQEQLLAELNGPSEPVHALPVKPSGTQPRSERREESYNA
jgi:hypothetical protein